MLRKTLPLILVLALAIPLAGPVSPVASQDDSVDWRQFEGTTLRILTLGQPYSEGLEEVVPEFEEMTGINVEQETLAQQAAIQKINVELATGTGNYDLVFAEGDKMPLYAQNDWIVAIDDFIADSSLTDPEMLAMDDFIQSCLDALAYEGEQYGLPFFAATVMMYYRQDVFEEYGIEGPPQTFEELLEVAETVHTEELPAIALRGQPGAVMNIWHWSMFLYGMGGNWVEDFPNDMTPTIDSPEAVEALEIYAELLQDYSIPGAASATYDDVVIAMQQGRVAMVLEGAPLGGRILDPEQSQVVGKLGFELVPGGPAGRFPPFTAQGLVIPSASRNQEAAYLFLQWATSADTLLDIALAERHVAVPRNSLWTAPEFVEKYSFDYGAGSYLDVFQETLEIAPFWYRPAFPEWPEIADLTGIAVQEAIVGEKSAEEALEDVNDEAADTLERAGYDIG